MCTRTKQKFVARATTLGTRIPASELSGGEGRRSFCREDLHPDFLRKIIANPLKIRYYLNICQKILILSGYFGLRFGLVCACAAQTL